MTALFEVGSQALMVVGAFALIVLLGRFFARPKRPPRLFADQLVRQQIKRAGIEPVRVALALTEPGVRWREGEVRVAVRDGIKVRYKRLPGGLLVLSVQVMPGHPSAGIGVGQ